jgi:hypothetical protein
VRDRTFPYDDKQDEAMSIAALELKKSTHSHPRVAAQPLVADDLGSARGIMLATIAGALCWILFGVICIVVK